MICINCFNTKTSVRNSRPHKKQSGTWRRRHCARCEATFTTYERPRIDEHILVISDSGDTKLFSLSKLTLSIANAFQHDPSTRETACLPLAETVEQEILREVKQPSSEDIAIITHTVLRRFDELAATQYAAQHQLLKAVRKRGRPSVKHLGD